MDTNIFLTLIDEVLQNPLLMLFVVQWGLGWYLKNKTTLNNNLIPAILLATGGTLGFLLLDGIVINKILIGVITAFFQIGAFEGLKSFQNLNK